MGASLKRARRLDSQRSTRKQAPAANSCETALYAASEKPKSRHTSTSQLRKDDAVAESLRISSTVRVMVGLPSQPGTPAHQCSSTPTGHSRSENDAAERESEPASAERYWECGGSAGENSADYIGNALIKTEDAGSNPENMFAEKCNAQCADAEQKHCCKHQSRRIEHRERPGH